MIALGSTLDRLLSALEGCKAAVYGQHDLAYRIARLRLRSSGFDDALIESVLGEGRSPRGE